METKQLFIFLLSFCLLFSPAFSQTSSAFYLWVDVLGIQVTNAGGNFDLNNDFETVLDSDNAFQDYTYLGLGGGGNWTLSYIQSNTQMKVVFSYNGSTNFPVNQNFSSIWVHWFTDDFIWQTPVNATFVANNGTGGYGPAVWALLNVPTVVNEAQFFILVNENDGSSYWLGNITDTESSIRALSINTNTSTMVTFPYSSSSSLPAPYLNGTLQVNATILLSYNSSRLRQLGCSGTMFTIAFVNFTDISGNQILDLRFSSLNDAGLWCYMRIPPNAVNVSMGTIGCDWSLNASIHDGPFYFAIGSSAATSTASSPVTSTSSATTSASSSATSTNSSATSTNSSATSSSSSATSTNSSATSSSSSATSSSSSSSSKSSTGSSGTTTSNGNLLFPLTLMALLLLSMI